MARLVPLNEVSLHNSEHLFFKIDLCVHREKKYMGIFKIFKLLIQNVSWRKEEEEEENLIDHDVLTMMDRNKTEKNGYEHFSISNTL